MVRGESSESFGTHHHLKRLGAPEGRASGPADVRRALHDERTWRSRSPSPSASQ